MHAYASSAKTIPTTITALHIFTPPSSISHLQKQNRFASEDGFYFTATFDTTPLTVRASYTVGTGWYHHGNLTPVRISAGRPLCLRLRLDGSIIVLFPCHCAAPRHRVLSADCIRSIPYSAVSVVINGHRGCLRASHSRLPAWVYPWLRLEENVQYRMDILFSKCREFPSHSLALEKAVFNHIVLKLFKFSKMHKTAEIFYLSCFVYILFILLILWG